MFGDAGDGLFVISDFENFLGSLNSKFIWVGSETNEVVNFRGSKREVFIDRDSGNDLRS